MVNFFDERPRYTVSTFGLNGQDMNRLYYLSTYITGEPCESYLLPVDHDPETAWFDADEYLDSADRALITLVDAVMEDARDSGLDYVWFMGA